MESIKKKTTDKEDIVSQYLEQLTPNEKKVLEIAKRQLDSSFDLEKSNGFIEWEKTNKLL